MRLTLAIALTVSALSTAAFAQSAEDQQACMDDAFRVCSATIPDRARTTACMVQNKAKLSPRCQQVMNQYAPPAQVKTAEIAPATPIKSAAPRISTRPGKPLNILIR